MNYADLFFATLPETILEIAALLVLVVDLGFLRKAALKTRVAVCGIARHCRLRRGALGRLRCGPIQRRQRSSARRGRLRRRRAMRHPHPHRAHASAAHRFRFHAQPRRICCRGADGRRRRPAHLRRAGSARHLRRPGTALARPLHPDRIQQAIRQERRSRPQVLPLRRNVGRISALRLQLSLRPQRLDLAAPRRLRHLYLHGPRRRAAALSSRWS